MSGKGGRRRLKGGYSVWLPDHSHPEGYIARRYLKAGEEIVGTPNGSEWLRIEIRRYAIAGVAYELAAQQHGDLVNQRTRGKGRRPNLRQVERAARRLGLAESSLKDATVRLEEIAGKASQRTPSVAELVAARNGQ